MTGRGWRMLYRLALRMLPSKFRRLYGAEMEETFRAAEAGARAEGGRKLASFYRRELVDVTRTGLSMRFGGGDPADGGSAPRESLADTVVQALRGLRRRPAHALVCGSILALATAAATASLGVVQQALLNELPYPGGNDLVAVYTRTVTWPDAPVSPHVLQDMRAPDTPLTGWVVLEPEGVVYSAPESARQVGGVQVTASFFEQLAAPAIGRAWRDGERDVVVVSHGFWQNTMGGVSDVAGRQIVINGVNHTVLGVLPRTFIAPFFTRAEVFRPLDLDGSLTTTARAGLEYTVIARLRAGETFARVDAWLETFSARLRQQYPSDHVDQGWWAEPLRTSLLGNVQPALLATGAAALLLLLIVCANVAGVNAAHAVTFRQRVSIQSALGATRGRLLREKLIEGLVLSTIGSAAGVWLGALLFQAVSLYQPSFLSRLPALALDVRVLLAAFSLGLLAGTLAATAPHLAVIGGRLSLFSGERGSTGAPGLAILRNSLVVAQVAVALVLVVGAGLLMRTVHHLAGTALGYRTEQLYTFQVTLPPARYQEPATHSVFENTVLERLRALPQVTAATASLGVPIIGGSRNSFVVRGRPDSEQHQVAYFSVAPGFMRMFQVPLRSGRELTVEDRRGAPRVLVINEMTARQVWPNGDAIGAQVYFGPRAPAADTGWVTVVGIVADVRQHGPTASVLPTAYGSTHQFSAPTRRFTIASATGSTAILATQLRAALHDAEPDAAMGELTALNQLVTERTARQRLLMLALVALGTVAIVICGVGLYAVVSLTSSLRTREYAIRMAIGAAPRRVRWLVLRQALALGALGATAGLAIALPGARTLQGVLHGVTPLDAPTYAGAITLLLFLALLAALLPALRSGRVAPAQVMKS